MSEIYVFVTYEQANAKFGTCDVPPISPPPPAAEAATGANQQSPASFAHMDKQAKPLQSAGILLATITLFAWL